MRYLELKKVDQNHAQSTVEIWLPNGKRVTTEVTLDGNWSALTDAKTTCGKEQFRATIIGIGLSASISHDGITYEGRIEESGDGNAVMYFICENFPK